MPAPAPPKVSVYVVGQENLRKKIQYMTHSAGQRVKAAVNDGALAIQKDAKMNCPVDTGRLRSSIQIQFLLSGLAATVGSNVVYAPFVEYGTGPFGKYTNTSPLPSGYAYGPRKGNWLGQKAKPYLFPAFEKHRKAIQDAVADAIKRGVI